MQEVENVTGGYGSFSKATVFVTPRYGTVAFHIFRIGQNVTGGYGTVAFHISRIGQNVTGGYISYGTVAFCMLRKIIRYGSFLKKLPYREVPPKSTGSIPDVPPNLR